MQEKFQLHAITVDPIRLPQLAEKKVEADILRLDKIHPLVSGNKWFKLRFYLDEAIAQQKKNIVTFGGAWSNHILATAAACHISNLKSIGIIRGEETATPSPTLVQAKEAGMQIVFINRQDYADKKIPADLKKDEYYFIPEGGFGEKGVDGAATILDYCNKENYTHICCAIGTGTMMAGLVKASASQQQVIGISVLKNNLALEENVKTLSGHSAHHFQINHDYHFGGYAKHKTPLLDFMNNFYRQTNIPTDFVYTGKLVYAITDLITADFFPTSSRLLLIHSGGLQGNSSLDKGKLIF